LFFLQFGDTMMHIMVEIHSVDSLMRALSLDLGKGNRAEKLASIFSDADNSDAVIRERLTIFQRAIEASLLEARCIVLLLIGDGEVDAVQVKNDLREYGFTQPPLYDWKTLRQNMINRYLIKNDIVEQIGGSWDTSYKLSEFGNSFVQPLAALVLKYVAENDILISEALGSPHSPNEKVSYIATVSILLVLLSGVDSVVDITRATGLINVVVSSHLRRLESLGLVDFDRIRWHLEETFNQYSLVTDASRPVSGKPSRDNDRNTHEQAIFDYLIKNNEASYQDLLEIVSTDRSSNLSAVLTKMVNDEILERRWHGAVQQSEIILTEEGVGFVQNFIFPALLLISGDIDTKENLNHDKMKLLEDDDAMHRVMKLYSEKRIRIPYLEKIQMILVVVKKYEPITKLEINQFVGNDCSLVIADLVKAGMLNIDNMNHYSIHH
jgi:hypothetical protein